jgi:hypothetical protein
MLTCRDTNGAATLSERAFRMDCRVKPGNDDVKNRSRDALTRPSFAHHHDARKDSLPARMIPKSGVRFSDKIMRTKGKRSAERRMPTMSALSQTSVRSLRHLSAPRLRAST